MLEHYLAHQEEVVTRRTQYDLNKAEARAHIVSGLLKALDVIDQIIKIIRSSKTRQEAKETLMETFGFSEVQAQEIVNMRLYQLTGMERERLEKEFQELEIKIRELKAILSDRNLLLRVIRQEILAIAEKYGDDRRTAIGYDEFDISMEDLIPKENTVIAMTKLGYIKRMTVDNFRSQNRGGKGIKGMSTIDDDYIEELLMTTTHHYLMFFTSAGRVYRIKAYEIPEASRTARGTAIINLLQLQPWIHRPFVRVTSAAGPLGGIGDALFWLTLVPITAGLTANIAMEGNILGAVLFLLIFNVRPVCNSLVADALVLRTGHKGSDHADFQCKGIHPCSKHLGRIRCWRSDCKLRRHDPPYYCWRSGNQYSGSA